MWWRGRGGFRSKMVLFVCGESHRGLGEGKDGEATVDIQGRKFLLRYLLTQFGCALVDPGLLEKNSESSDVSEKKSTVEENARKME